MAGSAMRMMRNHDGSKRRCHSSMSRITSSRASLTHAYLPRRTPMEKPKKPSLSSPPYFFFFARTPLILETATSSLVARMPRTLSKTR